MESTIASSLENTRLKIFEEIWAQRLADIDVGVALVYIIDTVPADALPFLAEQFDVLGYKGWDLTTTEQERRDLIKQAIDLHRTKGTPYAIKEALRRIGFLDAQITEGSTLLYDGSIAYNGEFQYTGTSWAFFAVSLDLGNQKGILPERTTLLRLMLEEYKAARCKLTSLTFTASLSEEVEATEDFSVSGTIEPHEDTVPTGVFYNGVFSYDGSVRSSGTTESFDLNAIFAFSETITASEASMPITQTFTNGTTLTI